MDEVYKVQEEFDMKEISDTIPLGILNCDPNHALPDKNHMELLKYTIYNKRTELEQLLQLKKDEIDMNKIYGRPFGKTIVEIACMEYAFEIEPECVLLLLKHGADKELALTSAGIGGNPKLLEKILDYFYEISFNIKYSPIILKTIENMQKDVKENFYAECIQLLINYGVDINLKTTNGPNAIFLAAKHNHALIVNVILNSSSDIVDLDSYKDAQLGVARDIILMNKLNENTLPPEKECYSYRNTIFLLQKHIDANDEYTFISEYTTMKNTKKMYIDYEKDLLIYAIEKSAINIVRYLIYSGLDVNSYDLKTRRFPLFVACKKGYYKIANILIDYSNETSISVAFVMMLQTVYFHQICLDEMDINHEKCFDILLDSKKLDINYKSEYTGGKCALYYAIKNQPNLLISEILEKGASLTLLDLDESTWSVFVSPDILEKHLNKCIRLDKVKEIGDGISLSVDFSTLLPVENNLSTRQENEDSENTILLESSSSLIQENNNNNNNCQMLESKVLEYMSNKSEYNSVLQHPLIHIYLNLKWQKLCLLFYLNLAFHLFYSFALGTYLALPYFNYKNTIMQLVLFYFIIIALSLLSTRELLQLYMTRCDYIKNYENYLDVGLLLLTITLLIYENENSATFKQISAFVIIFTTMNVILILGSHIDLLFSTITMLKSVTVTLLKFLIPFVILILAFSASFFILFHKETPQDADVNDENAKEKKNFFSNPGLSLFKTSLMVTGEFDAGEIDFSSYPITSPLFFIFFVFFMNIVLFGVFTALAINDIQKVKEIQSQICKIKQIVYMDKMLKCAQFTMELYRTVELDLLDSQLYMKNRRTKIKVHKEVMCVIKSIIDEKNDDLLKPHVRQCPELRHSTIKKRKVNRFRRQTINFDEHEIV